MIKFHKNFSIYYLLTALLLLVVSLLYAPETKAAIKCQELTDQRYCKDNGDRVVTVGPGQSVSLPAPVMSGYDSACWQWSRQFQCVETNPTVVCDSGRSFATVKEQCNLVDASIKATQKVGAITYITHAEYSYSCAWGDFTTGDSLPDNECVLLESTITDTNQVPSAGTNADTTAPLNSTIATEQEKVDDYVCYSSPVTNCVDVCYEDVYDAITGTMNRIEVSCTTPLKNCVSSTNQCDSSITGSGDTTKGSLALGPDGRCVSQTESLICQTGDVPRCLNNDNCVLDSSTPNDIQANGLALSETQNYICSETTTTCSKISEVSNCVHVGAWGWDRMQIKSQLGEGLGEYNAAMAKVDAIKKGINTDDLYIFSGTDLRCHYAVGNFLNTAIFAALAIATMVATGGASSGFISTALQSAGMATGTANAIGAAVSVGSAFVSDAPSSKAFGSHCCKDYVIEGSEAWYKLGSCSADEVKLSAARSKGLAHYIGTYCSKKSGFPIRQCVEKTKTYCVFDDMLALVINKQGRAQLDRIASEDPVTSTSTPEISFNYYGPLISDATAYTGVLDTGKWIQLPTSAGNQLWTWQYPGYCVNMEENKKAYDIFEEEVNKAMDMQGIQPENMTPEQGFAMLNRIVGVKPFQECSASPLAVSFLTCSLLDDSCDASRLPEGPSGIESDLYGEDVSTSDPNWRIQVVNADFQPGDYGVTTTMESNSAFAAIPASLSEGMSSVGSCHDNGNCLYRFVITDKAANNGLGARKRVEEFIQFPLYTVVNTSAWPSVDYVNQDGSMNMADYMADPSRGMADPVAVSNHRFIFHPNRITDTAATNVHSHVLLEWATHAVDLANPANDYSPILVPTTLPEASAGWYPYGDASSVSSSFYLSGGCDPNSRWCNYKVEVDLNIPRHPWGSAESPRCWGFSLDQIAALDFDQMDLSQWLNSLDLGAASAGLSADAAQAMTEQMTATAQASYSAFKAGEPIARKDTVNVALVTNTDILPLYSQGDYEAYVLKIAVPSNWPTYHDDQPNTNPVTNIKVDWGDGSWQPMQLHPDGRGYVAEHDYGDWREGTWKITVTLDTANNGPQTLTTHVRLTPNAGKRANTAEELDFEVKGANAPAPGNYIPSEGVDGTNLSEENIQQLSPGTAYQYEKQGEEVNK